MQVKLLRPVLIDGQHHEPRTVIVLSERLAAELAAMGKAERYTEPGPPAEPLPAVKAESDANLQRHRRRRRGAAE